MATGQLKTPYSLRGKRVWIAGHKGMVGTALCRRLMSGNCEILTVDREVLDLRVQVDVKDWIAQNKPDVIVIAAARVGGIGANAAFPAEFFYDNMMIEANIMHAAYETGVERLLFLGSSCIYPRDCPQPIREEYLLTGALEPTNEAYALAKIAGLKMAQYYRAQHGCDFITAMPCNLYGSGDTYHAEHAHVIPSLILKIHEAKRKREDSVTLWGTGTPLREFLYVDDLADALVTMLQKYGGDHPVNIGSGDECSIKDLSNIICEVIDYNGKVEFNPKMPDGTPRKVLDNTHILTLGWSPKICLKNGINKSYAEFLGGDKDGRKE